MKKIVFLFLMISLFASAQDTIIQRNGTKIISLVLMVGQDSIRYKRMDNITGADLYINKTDVTFIKYRNKKVENLDSLAAVAKKIKELENSPEKMYETGKFHADVNYQCKGCKAGFLAAGLVFGPIALIPAASVMFITPSDKKLAYPNEDLWANENYQRGYKDRARFIKRKTIITGAAVGAVMSSFAWGITALALQNRQQ